MDSKKFFVFVLLSVIIAGMTAGIHAQIRKEKIIPDNPNSVFYPKDEITMTVVFDNYRFRKDIETDWGFSCVVQTRIRTILFDTGADSEILLSNMERLGIVPEDIDTVVLSHNHGDHVDGLDGFLKRNGHVKVFIPVSFPNSLRDKITSAGGEYQDVKKNPVTVSENVHTTGEMGIDIKEQSLIVHSEKGLLVITGCAHPGIIDIVRRAKEVVPDTPVYLVMGGFHLLDKSDAELRSVVRGFSDLGVLNIAPSHCSGDRCREQCEQEFMGEYIESGVGKIISF